MTKVDVISGFLGAGKTTLIKKLLKEALSGEQVVLIENEFGEIGVDGGFLKEAGIEIREMNSGCICCSLVGDFKTSLEEVLEKYTPDRIIIEPSGVGKLSDVTKAVAGALEGRDVTLGSAITVVDAKKCRMYLKNFGEFFKNQVENAGTIILSRTSDITEAKLSECIALLKGLNDKALIITTPWEQLTGAQILAEIEKRADLAEELMQEIAAHAHEDDDDDECDDPECSCHHHHHDDEDEEHEHHHHHHHHDDKDEEHEHHHHHHHDDEDEDEEHEHHHHHHHDDEDEDEEHEHHHHHHHHDEEECDDPECGCHHHDEHEHHHHHHGHHHADEVFTSWGYETAQVFTESQLKTILAALNSDTYGMVLRSKGMVPGADGKWLFFDMVPGESDIREGAAQVTGRVCVIGHDLKEELLEILFGRK